MRKDVFPETGTIGREGYLVDPEDHKPDMAHDKLFFLSLRASLCLFNKMPFLIKRDFRIFVHNMAIGFKHGGILYNLRI
ncbi:MAG: hypothetical protein Q8R38_01515 [Candidatus Omnitrophota bacterium]|nr:hypothetical protein [Candidatus Omnitrophota bacterium]